MVDYQSLTKQVEIATKEAKTAEMYGAGQFDAIIGAEPDPLWITDGSYLRGYQDSYWELYKEKYGIQVQPESTEIARKNYAYGYFDGKIGDRPQAKLLISSIAYRSGYQEGIIDFYLEEAKTKLTSES